jgi:hypothetical protein
MEHEPDLPCRCWRLSHCRLTSPTTTPVSRSTTARAST